MIFNERLPIIILLIACSLAAFLQTTHGRPHIRHHQGGSHCSKCGPGWGVTSRCTKGQDTECGKCPRGTYSPHHSAQPCWICSRCGSDLYEAHSCTSRTDTVCDSCHRRAPDNPDFRRKCRGHRDFFLAPEDARNTGEQSILVNEPGERFKMEERELILREDVEADLGGNSIEESNDMRGL